MREKYEDLPIDMLTVRKQGIDKVLGQHVLNSDNYVTKPFGRKDLVERVKKMVEP